MEDPEALKRASAGSCIGRWFPPFPLRSNAACHPERRRREGPAFGRARRASRQQNRRSRAVRERRSFAPAYAARRQNPLRTLRDSRPFARARAARRHYPRGTLRDTRSFARARAARSLRMTAPHASVEEEVMEDPETRPTRVRRIGHRGVVSPFPYYDATEPVILSAAGAKDLLSAVPDARPESRTVARVRSLTPDPSLACRATTLPPWQPAGQQVLRSRACRALAQDDNVAWL